MQKEIKNRISEAFDIPQEIVLDYPAIKILGDIEILIENHKGIIEYTKEQIRINSRIGIILIRGSDLIIKQINQDEISIHGTIASISIIK
ncbi:sporulation protein YqfC [Caloramator mitchellensis]|nr:sporulation protein YqfC [Caloramator mitchellensis]